MRSSRRFGLSTESAAHVRPPRRSLHATGADQHQPRNGRRRAVLPRRGEEARRGRRLVHVLDQQTHFTHHVYVSAQRAVHEGQIDPGRQLLERRRRRGGRARPASTAPRGSGRRSSRCPGPAAMGGSAAGGSAHRARAPGRSHGSHGSIGSMCSITRHITTASNAPVGTAARRPPPVRTPARPPAPRPPRSGPRSDRARPPRRRDRRPPRDLPLPASRCRAPAGHPARCRSISGRICSSYSGSAPSVNSRCHHSACCSHSEGSFTSTAPFSRTRLPSPHSSKRRDRPVEVTSSLRGRPLPSWPPAAA